MTSKEILTLRDEYLTVEEFALLVQYNPGSIYRLVEQQKLPGVIRVGRGIRIERSVALQSIPVPQDSTQVHISVPTP